MNVDLEALAGNILAVAKAVAPMVDGGPQAVAAAEAALKLIDTARDIFSDADLAEVGETRAQLEARVNAHAISTEKKLRGEE